MIFGRSVQYKYKYSKKLIGINICSIDSITLKSKDRVLLYGQSTASENGIYTF